MKIRLLRNMFIVGSAALALAANTVVLPSVADAAGAAGVRPHTQGHSVGRVAPISVAARDGAGTADTAGTGGTAAITMAVTIPVSADLSS